jgi:protein-S-isoprenylcysteine O-methyltransferase Ste14
MNRSTKTLLYPAVFLAYFIGGFSMLAFGVFLYVGSFQLVSLGFEGAGPVVWDVLLCLAFFVQHSGMIRRSFRRRFGRIIQPPYQGVVYSIASGGALLLVVGLWQESPQNVYSVQGVFRWLFRGAFFLSFVGFAWSVVSLGSFDVLGIRPALAQIRGVDVRPARLSIRGPYRWVRHPLYFLVLILMWSCPKVSVDRLLFNVLWTLWTVLATRLEERDLLAEYGEAYHAYQGAVPMLLPYRLPNRD